MTNVLVISERENIIKTVNSIYNGTEKTIHSSEESVTFLNENNVPLVIVDLEVNDLNIFVAHELLKVCKSKNSSAVIIVYSDQTEGEVDGYQKLMHPPDAFIKDGEVTAKLPDLINQYGNSNPTSAENHQEATSQPVQEEEEPDLFSDEIGGELGNLDIFNEKLVDNEEEGQGIFIVEDSQDHSGEFDLSIEESSGVREDEISIKQSKKKKTSNTLDENPFQQEDLKFEQEEIDLDPPDVPLDVPQGEQIDPDELARLRQRAAQADELESKVAEIDKLQERVAEMNRLEAQLAEMDSLKSQVSKMDEMEQKVHESGDLKQRVSELEAEKISLEKQYEFMKNDNRDLLIRNNDQKKEIEAQQKDLESLKKEIDAVTKASETFKSATEETLKNKDQEIDQIKSDHGNQLDELNREMEQVKSDKKILESSLMDEISTLKKDNSALESEKESLNEQIKLIENTVADLEKQLNGEQEKSETLKNELAAFEKARDEKEKILITSIDHLKKNIKTEEDKNAELSEKMDKITILSAELFELMGQDEGEPES